MQGRQGTWYLDIRLGEAVEDYVIARRSRARHPVGVASLQHHVYGARRDGNRTTRWGSREMRERLLGRRKGSDVGCTDEGGRARGFGWETVANGKRRKKTYSSEQFGVASALGAGHDDGGGG